MNDRFYATLSLSMRAKKLLYGFDTVKEGVQNGSVKLLLTASDLSLKTVKEVAYLAGKHTLPHLPIPKTMEEIAGVIGKKTGVIGIADQGFADKLMLIHNETEEPNI